MWLKAKLRLNADIDELLAGGVQSLHSPLWRRLAAVPFATILTLRQERSLCMPFFMQVTGGGS